MEIQPLINVAGHQQNSIIDYILKNSIDDILKNFCNQAYFRNNQAFFQCLPPGYRFQPTDEELIVHYLAKKVYNQLLPRNKIIDVDLYQHNPDTLAEVFTELFEDSGEREWYFFTPRKRKYRNGLRPNRAAGDGYWKATGADKNINDSEGNRVGFRKALVFYLGKPPKGDKTPWIMHEYRVNNPPKCDRSVNAMRLDNWVLCRIYKKLDRTIHTKNPNMKNTEVENNNREAVKDVEIDPAPIASFPETENYNNFETPYSMIDPAYQNHPYMWCDTLPPHNIVGMGANLHHPAGLDGLWQHNSYAENWQVMVMEMESNNMKVDHDKEPGLTHNNSYLENWNSGINLQPPNAANVGLEIQNPAGEADQYDIDQYLVRTPTP